MTHVQPLRLLRMARVEKRVHRLTLAVIAVIALNLVLWSALILFDIR